MHTLTQTESHSPLCTIQISHVRRDIGFSVILLTGQEAYNFIPTCLLVVDLYYILRIISNIPPYVVVLKPQTSPADFVFLWGFLAFLSLLLLQIAIPPELASELPNTFIFGGLSLHLTRL